MKALLLCLCMVVCRPIFADQSIHRMLMDGKILELAETRQLTLRADGEVMVAGISPDGKYVAYADTDSRNDRLCLVRTTGGRPSVIMSVPPNCQDKGFTGEIWSPQPNYSSHIVWSPNSELFALPVSHTMVSADNSVYRSGVAVMRYSGALRQSFLLQEGARPQNPAVWSRDGRKLAVGFAVRQMSKDSQAGEGLLVLDVATGSMQVLQTSPEDCDMRPVSWSKDGQTVQYTRVKGKSTQFRESSLDGKVDRVIQEDYRDLIIRSDDGVFELTDKPGISISNRLTGETTEILKTLEGLVLGWTPDNKMLVYQRPNVIKDDAGKRLRTLHMLWLANAKASPINHMCVALDSYEDQPPTWSKDCMKMAYASDGRLYLAELVWKDLTVSDKQEVGVPLDEEEEKEILLANAKQIGTAINMYASDWDDKLPPGDDFMQAVLPYMRDKTVFFRPGTQTPIFQYYPLDTSNLGNWAGTVMGMFDVGYGWQIILYADGRARVVPK